MPTLLCYEALVSCQHKTGVQCEERIQAQPNTAPMFPRKNCTPYRMSWQAPKLHCGQGTQSTTRAPLFLPYYTMQAFLGTAQLRMHQWPSGMSLRSVFQTPRERAGVLLCSRKRVHAATSVACCMGTTHCKALSVNNIIFKWHPL